MEDLQLSMALHSMLSSCPHESDMGSLFPLLTTSSFCQWPPGGHRYPSACSSNQHGFQLHTYAWLVHKTWLNGSSVLVSSSSGYVQGVMSKLGWEMHDILISQLKILIQGSLDRSESPLHTWAAYTTTGKISGGWLFGTSQKCEHLHFCVTGGMGRILRSQNKTVRSQATWVIIICASEWRQSKSFGSQATRNVTICAIGGIGCSQIQSV